MSRAELARSLGLNRSSIGNIIADLLADGLVIERPNAVRLDCVPRGGRPGVAIEIDPHGATFIGAELGVEALTVVAADLAAHEIRRQTIRFAAAANPVEASIERLAHMINAMADRLPDRSRIRGLCVSIPALLDDRGVVRNALTLGWQQVPLSALLKRRIHLDVPILVENDANAFAIAETYRIGRRPSDVVAVLHMENGAGGGIVIGGRLFRGSDGFAGEFGQLVVGGAGFVVGPHKSGHLESYIGKDAVVARYRENGAPASARFEDLFAALGAGDPIAVRTASEWGERVARGLVHITSILNPALIILGGSVASIFPYVAQEIVHTMRKELLDGFPAPKIELSSFGPEGPALGGALLVHQRMFSIDEQVLYSGNQPATLLHA